MREVTAYTWVPDFAQGFVKDLRVRWALEEAGLAYAERLIDHEQKLQPEHLKRQPFAQVPVYRDDQVELFESGAIVMQIAEGSEALMPKDSAGRARTMSWAFAALNSVEPFVANVRITQLFHADAPWADGYMENAARMAAGRLARVADWLKGRDYLEGRFTAGDLLMATVLREMEGHALLAAHPVLEAYVKRCTGRPAFGRALEAQLKVFAAHPPQLVSA
ncbi:glutathione S-transferase family protein [Hyphomonas sp.]|uniref:glutathione S-transferase family protein n=1 Tax=Hyphomonas sp. TaxID=87 RepID=UPI00391B19DB